MHTLAHTYQFHSTLLGIKQNKAFRGSSYKAQQIYRKSDELITMKNGIQPLNPNTELINSFCANVDKSRP